MTKRTNLLVIVLDALRNDSADAILQTSERRLRAGTCIASAPWTLPSCTSLMTGTDALQHRHFWHDHTLTASGLVRTLPSEFNKVALVNNSVLNPTSQLNDGFDRWQYVAPHAEPFERAAKLIRRAGRRRPLFLLLHSNIPHDYFDPEASAYYDEAFPDAPGEAYMLGNRVITWNGTTPEERAAVARTYKASAMKALSCAREVLDSVQERDDFISVLVSDHGEGLDYDNGRIHHGGRLHDDLLRVPLYLDVPSTIPESQFDDVAGALTSGPVALTDVLPTLFALAGVGSVPSVNGRPIDSSMSERVVVSEERRYLYLNDRFRLNILGRNRWMSPQEREQNKRLATQLASPPLLRSYRSRTAKLIVTCLHLRTSESRSQVFEWGQRMLGRPMLVFGGDRLFAFELYDMVSDPAERHNLLATDGTGMEALLAAGRTLSATLPLSGVPDAAEVDIATVLADVEHVTVS